MLCFENLEGRVKDWGGELMSQDILLKCEKEILIGLFLLLGVVVGSAISFFGGLITKRNETKLKVIEKFIEKKLEAFEKINILINELRTVEKYDIRSDGQMRRYPIALRSKDNLNQLQLDIAVMQSHSLWLSTDLIREINFLQDYFVNLQ